MLASHYDGFLGFVTVFCCCCCLVVFFHLRSMRIPCYSNKSVYLWLNLRRPELLALFFSLSIIDHLLNVILPYVKLSLKGCVVSRKKEKKKEKH